MNRGNVGDTSAEAPSEDRSSRLNNGVTTQVIAETDSAVREATTVAKDLKATTTTSVEEDSLTDGLIGAAATHEEVERLVAKSDDSSASIRTEDESIAKKMPEAAAPCNDEKAPNKNSENVATDAAAVVAEAVPAQPGTKAATTSVPDVASAVPTNGADSSTAGAGKSEEATEDVLAGYEAPSAADVVAAAKANEISNADDSYVAPTASEVIKADNASNSNANGANTSKAAVAEGEEPSAETVSLEGLPPDEAAALVWSKLRSFASAKGETGVRDVFAQFDADSSGTLDKNEFKSALSTVGLPGASNKVVETVMKAASQEEGAGCSKKALDYASFAAALKPAVLSSASTASANATSKEASTKDNGAPSPKEVSAEVAPTASAAVQADTKPVESSAVKVGATDSSSAETVSLEGLPPDEAATLVWSKLRAFAATKGETGVRDVFAQFDADSSGTLDKNEFKSALATVGLPGASNKVVETVMKAASQEEGAGGSKKALDYASFAAALKGK